MSAAATRREALLGLAAAGALFALPVTAAARPTASRAAWDAAMAKWEAAKKHQASVSAVYDVAWDRWQALRPSVDLIDWDHVRHHPISKQSASSISKFDADAAYADFAAAEGKLWWGRDPKSILAKERKALDTVKEYQAREAHARKFADIDALGTAADAAGDELCAAWAELIKTPAPHSEALLFKLEQLIGEEGRTGDDGESYGDSWKADLLDAALVDARRLLSAGRA